MVWGKAVVMCVLRDGDVNLFSMNTPVACNEVSMIRRTPPHADWVKRSLGVSWERAGSPSLELIFSRDDLKLIVA